MTEFDCQVAEALSSRTTEAVVQDAIYVWLASAVAASINAAIDHPVREAGLRERQLNALQALRGALDG